MDPLNDGARKRLLQSFHTTEASEIVLILQFIAKIKCIICRNYICLVLRQSRMQTLIIH